MSETRTVLVCRTLAEARAGGIPEDVSVVELAASLKTLRLLDPAGAAKVQDPTTADLPICPARMPASCRLLRVSHRGEAVGVVVPTYRGGGVAQRDGIISQASATPDRGNLASFFRP